MEDEIARLSRREVRRMHRLERAKCQKCHGKVDLRGLHRAAEGDERFVRDSLCLLATLIPHLLLAHLKCRETAFRPIP
jgi:myosin protein heavy chain